MKKYIIILLLILSTQSFADTHTVSGDCSASAVQTAINAASAGDIIDVACTGTVTWSSGLTLSGGKTLRGGGEKTGAANTTTGTWPLTINVTYDGSALISVTNDNSQSLNRVTGFKFQGSGSPTTIIHVSGRGTGTDGYGAFRIDNNYFNSVSYGSRLTYTGGTTGKMTGLFDHNVFYYDYSGTPHYGLSSYANPYRGDSSTCYGYDSKNRAVGHGTDDFVFWEDNYLKDAPLDTAGEGGRLVMRYNYASSSSSGADHLLDGHGADTGGYHACGTVANEFYKNTLEGTFAQIVDMRSGKWMVHNNTMEGGVLQINEYRITGPQYLEWKACSGDFCCPTTPPQCNIQAPTAGDFSSCYPLPNQVSSTYLWNNIQSGSNMSPHYAGGSEALATYIALNRDYWMPTYGTEANLPATCTDDDNTFYGATDSGKLWECTGTNTWTLKYTPYTYPHPLQGGEDETPPTVSSVTISSNGTDLVIVFSESITATDNAAFTVDPSGSNVTVDCPAVETATNTMTCVISRAIQYSETAVYGYTGTNVVDTSANALATISNTPSVANNSTQGITPGTATHSGGIFGGCVFQ